MSASIALSTRNGILHFAILLVLAGCAGQRPPEGGPVDTTPPEIISVYPAPNTTSYTDKKIAFEFSKYVDRRSVEESIFISPYVKDVEFDWSGREVEMTFQEPLKKNTTYVVTVGTDVQDLNNRNRMAHAFSVAFSTGVQIDRGTIERRVYDSKPSGVMVFAYKLDDINPDTLNPMTLRPDYITQTGSVGDYALSHLSFGTYRVFAVRDEFRNLLYDPETDEMSTAPEDLCVDQTDTIRTDVNFQLSMEDTTAPRLLSATAIDNRHIELAFSEILDSASVSHGIFAVYDTSGMRKLGVSIVFLHAENPAAATLMTERQEKDSLYRVLVSGVKDRAGHIINPLASSKQFTGSSLPDTIPPGLIAATIADTMTRHPVSQWFEFDFNDAVQSGSALNGIALRGKDSAVVPYRLLWNNAASFELEPSQNLRPNYSYTFVIHFDSLRDETGNHWKDSTRKFTVRTIDPEMVSSIEGTLVDGDTLSADRYVVQATIDNDAMKRPVRIAVQRGKKFMFPQLTEGEYRLEAFQDAKNTGYFSSGRPYPFEKSERFAVYRDSIKVRARWPVEGVIIEMNSNRKN